MIEIIENKEREREKKNVLNLEIIISVYNINFNFLITILRSSSSNFLNKFTEIPISKTLQNINLINLD